MTAAPGLDAEIQRLRRAAGNGEDVAEELDAAYLRAGLGWAGEEVPGSLRRAAERGVYVLEAGSATLQLVHVPGGLAFCHRCWGQGRFVPGGEDGDGEAEDCAPWLEVEPFFIGRFPVTWEDFLAYASTLAPGTAALTSVNWGGIPLGNGDAWSKSLPWPAPSPMGRMLSAISPSAVPGWLAAADRDFSLDPVVNISFGAARRFCEWAGARLASEAEWQWAWQGPSLPCLHPGCDERSGRPLPPGRCLDCHGTGRRWRQQPWDASAYDQEHCVWEQHPEYGGRTTAPVAGREMTTEDCRGACGSVTAAHGPGHRRLVATGRLLPARPAGASWCGAHDMAGNCWEWRSGGTAMGGSFRTEYGAQLDENLRLGRALYENNGITWNDELTRDDLGFRVALSA